MKAGPKAWKRATAERSYRAIQHDFEALRVADPQLAALVADGFPAAAKFFAGSSRKTAIRPAPALFKTKGSGAKN
jgi:hypothetical protein